jgi:hypothetical protein
MHSFNCQAEECVVEVVVNKPKVKGGETKVKVRCRGCRWFCSFISVSVSLPLSLSLCLSLLLSPPHPPPPTLHPPRSRA